MYPLLSDMLLAQLTLKRPKLKVLNLFYPAVQMRVLCPFLLNPFLGNVSKLDEKKKKMKRKKKKTGDKEKSAASASKSQEKVSDPFEDALKLIEQDTSILNKLPAEAKQQVFYVLLIRGETLVKENKSSESVDKAVEYFVKAVALVSHPGEVLMSYEQTLPADIFKRIISELQKQNIEKTKAYFDSLAPEDRKSVV